MAGVLGHQLRSMVVKQPDLQRLLVQERHREGVDPLGGLQNDQPALATLIRVQIPFEEVVGGGRSPSALRYTPVGSARGSASESGAAEESVLSARELEMLRVAAPDRRTARPFGSCR